ncbi:MAG: kelch repeat-containing protein [Bryobacteraceae bacterium]
MRTTRICLTGLAAAICCAAITLPESGVLAGPLDDARTSFGDDISNYPFGNGVASINLHGWVSIEFSPPSGRISRFQVRWHAVAGVPRFAFANGHYIDMHGEQALSSSTQISQGRLNLDTGEVTNLEVHAIFQNILIQKSSRYNRLPMLSDASGFSALFVDFPPIEFPFPLPFPERPQTSLTASFKVDSNQRITGFEFHGTSFIPITVLPKLGITAPYVFGREGITVFPGMDGCLPGTTPPSQCITEQSTPDGIEGPLNAILSPNLHLVTSELRESGGARSLPVAIPSGATMGAAAASLGGQLFLTGGSDGNRTLRRAASYDPAARRWSELPDMPYALWRHCAAAAGGKLYLAGGRTSLEGPALATVSVYEPAARSWSTVAAMPGAAASGACAALDGRFYFFGGATASAPASDSAWVFEPSTGQWSGLAPMPVALSGSAVAVNGRDIWVVNGTTDGTTATNRVFIFSSDSGVWREGPPTDRPVHDASAALFEGRLWVAGGRSAPAGRLDLGQVFYHLQTLQILAPNGIWYPSIYPPLPASGMAGAVVGDTWYLAGGDTATDSSPTPSGIVQALSPARGWVASDTYPVFVSQNIRNAAGLGVGPAELAPGTAVAILGSNMAGRALTAPPVRALDRYLSTDLPEELGGVRVTVDDSPAGLIAVSPDRIDFQVPFGLATGRTVAIRVSRDGALSPPAFARLVDAAPGIYTFTYGEKRSFGILNECAAIVANADGKLNYPSQPAHPGDTVTLRVTGLGEVDPRPAPFQRGPREAAAVVRMPEVLIDGKPAVVQSAQLAPGEAGLYNVRVTIPLDARTGIRVLVQVRTGGISSNVAVLVIE